MLWRMRLKKALSLPLQLVLLFATFYAIKCLLAMFVFFVIQLAYMLTGERLEAIGQPAGGAGLLIWRR